MNECLQHLLRTPLFAARERHHLPLRAYMDLTIRRMHAIFNAGVINNDMWLGQPDESHFRALCEQIGVIGAYDYALYSSLVDHMIATRMYTTNVKWWPQIAQAHKEFFEGCEPTTMLLGVKALITPDYLVEIEAQAQAPEARP